MSQLATKRLMIERKKWRKDGKLDLFIWDCGVPGKENTPWAGGKYKVSVHFPQNYPTKPPLVKFEPGFFHVNVYQDGRVCLSIINEGEDWKAGITVKQILLGVQDLLNNPNPKSPANQGAATALRKGMAYYNKGVAQMVRKYRSDL